MKAFFKKRKILEKGFLSVSEAYDPQSIIWENLGQKEFNKCGRRLFAGFIAFILFCIVCVSIVWVQTLEKTRIYYAKGDCSNISEISELDVANEYNLYF